MFGRRDRGKRIDLEQSKAESTGPTRSTDPEIIHRPARTSSLWSSSQFFSLNSLGKVKLTIDSIQGAERAQKEIRLHKRALGIEKRRVNQEMTAVRRTYTAYVTKRTSVTIAGKTFNDITDGVGSMNAAMARAEREKVLAPLDVQKRKIDAELNAMDQAIFLCDEYILKSQIEFEGIQRQKSTTKALPEPETVTRPLYVIDQSPRASGSRSGDKTPLSAHGPVSTNNFCTVCGTPRTSDMKFCAECGSVLVRN